MRSVVETGPKKEGPTARPTAPAIRTARPVLWWAALGAVFLAQFLYVFVRYITDLPENVSAGPTAVPWWMRLNIHAQEVIFVLIAVPLLLKFVILPLVRRAPVPWDGLMILAFISMIWQDTAPNWFRWYTSYNSVVINRGSWNNHILFWTAPNARRFAEAPLIDFGFYVIWAAATIWLCFVMRKAKTRWPHLGNVGLFGVILVFCFALDFAVESLWLRGGLYTYAGAPRGWYLLFQGHYYQFPLYEMLLYGGCLAAMAAVRYFKNDKGQSLVERKIEDVHIGRRGKTILRLLALIGVFNLLFLAYNLSFTPINLRYMPDWPEDILKRSYFTQGMCGAKTDMMCPGPGVPIPGPDSAYLNRQGGLSHPRGWTRPTDVTFDK